MTITDVGDILIERAKIVEYLLNVSHPDNGGKAAFFLGWGFTVADWPVLADAIRDMVAHAPILSRLQSPWGVKYVVDGPLRAPNGVTPTIRTIWIVDGTRAGPRLVTAYPQE